MELHYISRNNYWKNLDVADAACCCELWHGVSIKILGHFVRSVAAHTTRFLKKGVLCAVLLLGFAGPPCFLVVTLFITSSIEAHGAALESLEPQKIVLLE